VIDRDTERLATLGSGFNGQKIKGIEFDNDILLEAGIREANAIIAATSDDNINITVALIAQKIYKISKIIARVNNPEKKSIYEQLNIDTVNPVQYEIDILKDKLLVRSIDFIAVLDNDYEIIKLPMQRLKTVAVEELESRFQCRIPLISVNGTVELCQRDTLLNSGDKAICIVQKTDKENLINYIYKETFI